MVMLGLMPWAVLGLLTGLFWREGNQLFTPARLTSERRGLAQLFTAELAAEHMSRRHLAINSMLGPNQRITHRFDGRPRLGLQNRPVILDLLLAHKRLIGGAQCANRQAKIFVINW